ncbi:unnamed protein product [Echinostoma caproni]|uniref:Polyhomeotic-like protein 3 n=1 Tax=Echinostoma caproni TaxID=27848 RepID=A0A183B3M7_9TREM|nr:unnamed protein product [Echinostoma caproni]
MSPTASSSELAVSSSQMASTNEDGTPGATHDTQCPPTPARHGIPVSVPTPTSEAQSDESTLMKDRDSCRLTSPSPHGNVNLVPDVSSAQDASKLAQTSPKERTPPNSSDSELCSPSTLPHVQQNVESQVVVQPASQSSKTSPHSSSLLSNGTSQTDNAELQASLERLGVSNNQMKRLTTVQVSTAAVTSVTVTRSTHPRPSTLRTAGVPSSTQASLSKLVHTATSALRVPPPLLHHGPDDRRILTHYIDGHVKHGMSVVEAALLHQCIKEEEEQQHSYFSKDVPNTVVSRVPRSHRSSSSSSGAAPDAPSSQPEMNGDQRMQIDVHTATDKSKETIDTSYPTQPASKRPNFAPHSEQQSTQCVTTSVSHNGYPVQQAVYGSKDNGKSPNPPYLSLVNI